MNAMNDHHAYIVLSLYLRNVDIVLYWFLLVICGQYSLSQYTRIRRWHSICCNVSNVECSIFLTLSSTPSIDSNVFFSSTLSNYHLLCTFKKVLSVTASPCANKSGKEENTNTKASNMKQHGWQPVTEAIVLTKWMTNSFQWRRHQIVSLIECIILFYSIHKFCTLIDVEKLM